MKRAMRYTSLLICVSLGFILLTPSVLALTRRTHLTTFIESARTPSGGYQSTALPTNESEGTPDLISTLYAINMSLFLGKTAEDFIDTSSWILDNMKTASSGFRTSLSDTTATMTGMFMASLALNVTQKLSSLGDGPRTWVENRLNVTSGGFNDQEIGITTTLATYYAVDSLFYLNNISTIVVYSSNVKNYLMSCYNPDGGFAQIVGKNSTLQSTWAAVAGLYRLGQLTGFSLADAIDVTKTLAYVEQFYFSNNSDAFNYGGYGTSGRAMVRDTFYAQMVYSLLGETNPHATTIQNYILGCQNIADGGFAEKNLNGNYWTSSMTTTYFAFSVLLTFDPQLAMLNEEIWFLPFDFVTLIIILIVVIVGIAAAVHYYRKRHE